MRLALLLLVPLAAGCAALDPPEARELVGPTDGYTPTAAFLKLHVKRDDGSTALLDFDRRDWYAAKIAEMVDLKQVTSVSAVAKPRDILNEYLAQTISSPTDLAKLRYDNMGATPEQRTQMDNEYQRLLERYLEDAPIPPSALLPQDPIP